MEATSVLFTQDTVSSLLIFQNVGVSMIMEINIFSDKLSD